MFKLCVFDMDGTVVNSIADITAAMNRSLEKMGKCGYSENEYLVMVGNGMELLCKRALNDDNEADLKKLIELYKNDYMLNCCDKTAPYEGMVDLIKKLRSNNVKTALLSNKPHSQVLQIIDKLFDEKLFDTVLGQTPEFPAKPNPESLFHIMKLHGATCENTAYIGDSNVDISLGKAGGVFSAGVTWGFRTKEELLTAGADAIVDNTDELYNVLSK